MQQDDLARVLSGLRDAVRAQTAGLHQLLGAIATQTKMLEEILAAATAEPSDLIPELIRQMTAVAEGIELLRNAIEHLGEEMRQERPQ